MAGRRNEPGLKGSALVGHGRSGLETQWNGGIMEYRVSKKDDGQILICDPCHPYKNRSHSAKPIIPTFQYSIIPLRRNTAQPFITD
jgi:hypothetical protein